MVILDLTQGISASLLKAGLSAASSGRFKQDLGRVGRCGTVISSVLISVWFPGTMLACFLTQTRCWRKLKTLISE